MFTTNYLRFALATAATVCAVQVAEAKPRRVVVLDFDGQRQVADQSRSTVVSLLGESYDVVATKRWEEARAQFGRNNQGPSAWSKAARQAGVDAVVEGWVDDEGSYKLLTVQVRDAKTGTEIDNFQVRIGKNGISEQTEQSLRTQLDELLEWVTPGAEAPQLPQASAKDIKSRKVGKSESRERESTIAFEEDYSEDEDEEIVGPGSRGSKRGGTRGIGGRGSAEIEFEDDSYDQPDDGRSSRKAAPAKVSTATVSPTDRATADDDRLLNIFGKEAVESKELLGITVDHTPVRTTRFMIEGGFSYISRTLAYQGEDPQNFSGIGSKAIVVQGAVYPLPQKKYDGQVSGIGFSAKVYKAPNSSFLAENADGDVVEHSINFGGWEAAVHWRQPLGELLAFDARVGYGQQHYVLESDAQIDVPDTDYGSFHAGGKLDLNITKGARVGVAAAYHYVTTQGMIVDIDWQGPANTSGLELGADFVIPLPKQLYVRGEVNFRRYSSEFQAADAAADPADSADDSTVSGTGYIGVAF
jgi:hypothetical protein